MAVTYIQLLSDLPDQNARLLTLWAMGQRIYSNEPGETTVFKDIMDSSFNAGYLIRTTEGRENRDGQMWNYFEAIISPEIAPMLAQLVQERLMLSRLPINF